MWHNGITKWYLHQYTSHRINHTVWYCPSCLSLQACFLASQENLVFIKYAWLAHSNGLPFGMKVINYAWWSPGYHHRADSRCAPRQWETALLCNYISHRLGTSLESAQHHVIWPGKCVGLMGNESICDMSWQSFQTWWWKCMKMLFVLLTFCERNLSVTSGFPLQRASNISFNVFLN